MKKPLLIILLVVAVGLLTWRFAFYQGAEPVADVPETAQTAAERYNPEEIDGVETDEEPEFNVVVDARMEGTRPVLEFSITETHGWAVTMLYVEASHGTISEETGEWAQNTELRNPPKLLCKEILDFGKTLVDKTTLTTIEMLQINQDLGTSENWRARVYKWGKVYKPK
ncbi:MAG TPA: hypothetical protein VM243_20230 [Phycisphaerae bacterium]|nr:hypothetical protein [Phycisphaerae bacterium]